MRLKDGQLWKRGEEKSSEQPQPHSEPGRPNTALLRRRLRRLDSVEIESLCLDHFPEVYDKFARGLQRGEMINLLLDHCRRHPEDANRLNDLLK
jgi:hypothetical protein